MNWRKSMVVLLVKFYWNFKFNEELLLFRNQGIQNVNLKILTYFHLGWMKLIWGRFSIFLYPNDSLKKSSLFLHRKPAWANFSEWMIYLMVDHGLKSVFAIQSIFQIGIDRTFELSRCTDLINENSQIIGSIKVFYTYALCE